MRIVAFFFWSYLWCVGRYSYISKCSINVASGRIYLICYQMNLFQVLWSAHLQSLLWKPIHWRKNIQVRSNIRYMLQHLSKAPVLIYAISLKPVQGQLISYMKVVCGINCSLLLKMVRNGVTGSRALRTLLLKSYLKAIPNWFFLYVTVLA